MGIFGRSRANTTNGGISQPVLTFSDAAPRDDLQSLGKLESTHPRPYTAKPEKQAGTTTSNGRGLRQKHQKNVIQAFDFTVTQPPEGPLIEDEPAGMNGGMVSHAIGIALGSPSMVPPPQYRPIEWSSPSSERQQDPSMATTTSNTGSLRRKPSKWKKFGGMLKGSRQNEGKRTREGFYQLDMTKSQDETVPVIQDQDYKQPIVSVSPGFNDGRWEDQHQKARGDSLLRVNIPTVEMERYSVMFRSVLGEKPSSNLLARRSRALNQLHVDGMEVTEPGLHEPHKPQRRATSPSTNRSSTFTLFPGVPQNKIIINGTDKPTPTANEFAPRSPIRSNTFPRVAKNNHDNHLAIPDLTPALSTGTSSGFSSAGYSSAEPSPIPFNAPTTARDYINPQNEPVWEMITTKKSSGSPEGVRPSADIEMSPKPTSTPTMTTPLIPQDHNAHRAKPTTKPSIAVLPPRKASLPAYADRAKLKVRSNNNNNNTIQKDNDPLLSVSENHPSPNPDGGPPQLVRSQTMPLPLTITKKQPSPSRSNTTPLLHPTPSTDSLLAANDTSFTHSQSSSQSPSPLIPQTIEISIARSVSVSRRIIPKQTLVPLGANPHVFFHNENERYGELKAHKKGAVLIDVGSPTAAAAGDGDGSEGGSGSEGGGLGVRGSAGHRYQKSQDIVIESA
ncbi:hypothetical protein TCE0_043r15827 [Talaromyces pinophilus]|uniref:Uncharacterized protein n=1 Tax=Talaromyces pinophilus TaxID=128442 RepID=A0A0B8N641_TALPI|nr:hypothetical protein TCE0_043r15827 [Talaromyces pinophilus]